MRLTQLAIHTIKRPDIKEAIIKHLDITPMTFWRIFSTNEIDSKLTLWSVVDIIHNMSGLTMEQILDRTSIKEPIGEHLDD